MTDIKTNITPTHIGKLIGTPTEAMCRLASLLGDEGPYQNSPERVRHCLLRKFGDMVTQSAMGMSHGDRDLIPFEIDILGQIFILTPVTEKKPARPPKDATKSALEAFLKLFEDGERKGSLFLSPEHLKRLTARAKRALKHYRPAPGPPSGTRSGYQGAHR